MYAKPRTEVPAVTVSRIKGPTLGKNEVGSFISKVPDLKWAQHHDSCWVKDTERRLASPMIMATK